jgi:hypothetical protein
MIMANQTIIGTSTFSVMPAIASFGTSYIPFPVPNTSNLIGWLSNPPRIDNFTQNVVLYEDSNIISARNMKQLWKNEGEIGVLNWFLNDSIVY